MLDKFVVVIADDSISIARIVGDVIASVTLYFSITLNVSSGENFSVMLMRCAPLSVLLIRKPIVDIQYRELRHRITS